MKQFTALLLALALLAPRAHAGIIDGQPVNAAVTNAAFINKNTDDTTPSKLGLANTATASGASVTNLQAQVNAIDSYAGVPGNSAYNVLPTWTNNNVGTSSDTLKARLEAISALFVGGSVLPISKGGTGQTTAAGAFNALSPMTTLGDLIYGGSSGAGTRLAGNTTTSKYFLTQTGTGTASAAPAWSLLVPGDLPTITLTGDLTGSASGGTIAGTLASVGTAGTYTKVTTDAKGRVTSGTTLAAGDLPTITLTGDATGNGSGGTVPVTLANSGVTAGSYTNASVTVDAKGRVTAASTGSATSTTESYQIENLGLSASVASNALTVAFKQADGSTNPASGAGAVTVGFRSSTATNGNYNLRTITAALSIVVSSGASLGQSNGKPAFTYVYLQDNAGAPQGCVASAVFDEGTVQTSTTMSGSATSATTLYCTAGATGAIRLVGRVLATETTAGTWATGPSELVPWPFKPGKQIASASHSNNDLAMSSTSFAAFTHDLTLTFNANRTGNYKVYSTVPIRTNVDRCLWHINNGSGGATALIVQDADSIFTTSTWEIMVMPYGIYFLTAGTSYTFNVQYKAVASNSCDVVSGNASTNTFLVAEEM